LPAFPARYVITISWHVSLRSWTTQSSNGCGCSRPWGFIQQIPHWICSTFFRLQCSIQSRRLDPPSCVSDQDWAMGVKQARLPQQSESSFWFSMYCLLTESGAPPHVTMKYARCHHTGFRYTRVRCLANSFLSNLDDTVLRLLTSLLRATVGGALISICMSCRRTDIDQVRHWLQAAHSPTC
jgi:hypothetical protein